ncbi:hypothetical protein K0B96_14035 [Horticoccus luteus]|uniref:EF-hand domain-containing protein n=1 Tax=Horticoccus luteus TaxID=2862869 RepID=A0A8F9TST7_9BACT|nr:hypothetical protein [Horticoccus luteus]QYM78406.1 hypothetical protein K0B96_14035 [Horticoccus luteus]
MKLPIRKLLLLVGAMSLAAAFTVPALHAQEATDAPKAKKAHKVSAKDLAKYDTNKDGVLDKDERAAMKADKAKMKAEREAKKAKKDAAMGEDQPQTEK